eukprot:scaffold78458_cov60-Phaeocystis_antarctica.AAC.2
MAHPGGRICHVGALPAQLRQHGAHRRARRRAHVRLAPLEPRCVPHLLLRHVQPTRQVCGGAHPCRALDGARGPLRPLARPAPVSRKVSHAIHVLSSTLHSSVMLRPPTLCPLN